MEPLGKARHDLRRLRLAFRRSPEARQQRIKERFLPPPRPSYLRDTLGPELAAQQDQIEININNNFSIVVADPFLVRANTERHSLQVASVASDDFAAIEKEYALEQSALFAARETVNLLRDQFIHDTYPVHSEWFTLVDAGVNSIAKAATSRRRSKVQKTIAEHSVEVPFETAAVAIHESKLPSRISFADAVDEADKVASSKFIEVARHLQTFAAEVHTSLTVPTEGTIDPGMVVFGAVLAFEDRLSDHRWARKFLYSTYENIVCIAEESALNEAKTSCDVETSHDVTSRHLAVVLREFAILMKQKVFQEFPEDEC